MKSVTGSRFVAKCSNTLQDNMSLTWTIFFRMVLKSFHRERSCQICWHPDRDQCYQNFYSPLMLWHDKLKSGNTKGGNIIVPFTSCLTGLELALWQLTIFVCICKTDWSKPVKQEVNGTVILPPFVFPARVFVTSKHFSWLQLSQ